MGLPTGGLAGAQMTREVLITGLSEVDEYSVEH